MSLESRFGRWVEPGVKLARSVALAGAVILSGCADRPTLVDLASLPDNLCTFLGKGSVSFDAYVLDSVSTAQIFSSENTKPEYRNRKSYLYALFSRSDDSSVVLIGMKFDQPLQTIELPAHAFDKKLNITGVADTLTKEQGSGQGCFFRIDSK